MTTTPIVRAVSRRAQELLDLEAIHRDEPDIIDLSGDELGNAITDDVCAASPAGRPTLIFSSSAMRRSVRFSVPVLLLRTSLRCLACPSTL